MARTTHIANVSALPQADQADGCPHPREVYDLVGHEKAESQIAERIDGNKLHHAWLISGATGIGKATLAYRMIRRVLGGAALTQGRLDVPSTDPTAQRLQSLGHGDFLLVRRPYDEKTKKIKSEIPISEIRKVSSFFTRKASEGGWRVCLIDTIDDLNRNAANALLKTLEEPSKKALIILLSKTPGQLLPTIRSRCMELPLRSVDNKPLSSWLHQHIKANEQDVIAASLLAKGAPGKAYALVQNADKVLRPLGDFIASFPQTSPRIIHMVSDSLASPQAALQYELFWDALLDLLYAQALYAATGEWDSAFQPIALKRGSDAWMDIHAQLHDLRAAQAGLNMNKKTVLMQALSIVGA